MRRARKSALFRTALAAVLAAVTVPFLAHAAFGETTALTAPAAQLFPTRTGVGITWEPVTATSYQVERRTMFDWQTISGMLPSSTISWIDESIAAGATADYRVVATTDTESATSGELKATRPTDYPAVGTVDALALDANSGAGFTWLKDEVAGPVTASAPANGTRTLSAGTISLKMPAFLAGAGYYEVPIELTQSGRTCATTGVFRVKSLTYTPDLQLETFASSLGASCPGAESTGLLEIRYRSKSGYQIVSVTPDKLDAGRVLVGSSKSIPVTIQNTGSDYVQLGNYSFSSGGRDWKVAARDCGQYLPTGASCTVTLKFEPTQALGEVGDRLTIGDSTGLQHHEVKLTGTSVSLPSAPNVFNVASTYTGVALSWQTSKTAGGTPVRGYFVHRFLDGVETTQWVEPEAKPWMSLIETAPKPGTKYALSVVNEIGEGPASTPTAAGRPTEQIAVTIGQPNTELASSTLSGYVVPIPTDPEPVTPKDSLAAAPDGRVLAYTTTDSEQILWTQLIGPGQRGGTGKLWTSAAPMTHLAWSPDGSRIAFQSPENETPCVYVIPAVGGTPVKIACDVTGPSWMPDAQTLIVSDRRFDGADRFARIQAAPGGARVATLPAPTAAADGAPVRVSPDGQRVAFGAGSDVKLISLTSDKIEVAGSLDSAVRSITWNPDGTSLMALTSGNKLYSVNPSTLRSVELDTNTVAPRRDIAWQQLRLVIAAPPRVVGPNVSILFDSSALLSGTTFTCSAGGSAPAPCSSPYQATSLRQGENTVTVTATEPDGRVTTVRRTVTVDATGPVARVTAPAYQSSVAATAKIAVAATDAAGVASYDVRYRRASFAGPYSAYVQPWTNTTATSMSLAVAAGYEYCVSVRAKDKLGNVGVWSAERCFSRPLDDRSMTMATTGWGRGSSSKFYFGTDTQTTASGKALTRTVQGKRFFLVATRCPSCGAVAVYAGNKLLTTVNLAYPTTHYQVLLGLPVQSTVFSGTLTVRTVTTGKMIQIDGLAVGRS
ncbi:hypothetical protein ACWEOO_24705 [Kribbella sp. NPDC004138]